MSIANESQKIVPSGTLLQLGVNDIKPNPQNPRRLFDPEPLNELKESIRVHGVLVPITAYKLPGQNKYGIVDGERRYRCCLELSKEGLLIEIPTNIVKAPDETASLIYMFNIHTFREQWELMPTALSLREIKDSLHLTDTNEIHQITGLSVSQIERCERILSFPKQFQEMSLEQEPSKRIPSNFWVELYPVLEQLPNFVPDLLDQFGRDGITEKLVDKYNKKKIKSVIHFRRVLEAIDIAKDKEIKPVVADAIREWILDTTIDTKEAFDKFSQDTKRVQKSISICDNYVTNIKSIKVELMVENKEEIIKRLEEVISVSQLLLDKLMGLEPPENH